MKVYTLEEYLAGVTAELDELRKFRDTVGELLTEVVNPTSVELLAQVARLKQQQQQQQRSLEQLEARR